MFNDLRFAVRMIAKHPWFSATVIVTLAFSIGLNTAVFTLVNAALLKPVPLPGGNRLVVVEQQDPRNPKNTSGVSLPQFIQYRAQAHAFSALEAAAIGQAVISDSGGPPARYDSGEVSTGLFEMLQVPPVLGRPFSAADGKTGSASVALISYAVWQNRYGGSPDVIGRGIRLNGKTATLVGVMPKDFRFPSTEDIWTPLMPTPENLERSHRTLRLYGLLAPDTGISSAQGDLTAVSLHMAREFPSTDREVTALVLSFQDAFNGGPIRLIFLLMLGAVGFVLLIACANVANMMLSRSLTRAREIALRTALGASRLQIVRLLLVECMLLSILGGIAGLLLSPFGVRAFDLASQDVGRPYWIQFTMDWRAFAFFAAISLASGIVFGLVPALRASRADLNAVLKDGSAGATRGGGRLSGILVVFQFALTVVLLCGAGVMIRGFMEARQLNPFVPGEHILTARINLPDGKGERYESVAARRQMHDTVLARLMALPGVDQASLASDMPGMGSQVRDIEIDGHPNPDPKRAPHAAAVFVTPNYLSTIRLPLLSGRTLNGTDGEEGREASVVTRSFAARFWPGESPLGRRFRFVPEGKPAAWITVVGVCADIVQDTMVQSPPPLAYFSNRQEPWAWLGILILARGDPGALASSVRTAIQGIDPELPLFEVRTLPAAIEHQHWFLKVFGSFFSVFALIALLMASVGVYAVVSHSTSLRTREIGIRMALGAQAGRVVRMVLSRGALQLGLGLAIGLGAAIAATRLMASVPGMTATGDPLIFGGAVLVLACFGLTACWLPARRAARIPPTEALRTD